MAGVTAAGAAVGVVAGSDGLDGAALTLAGAGVGPRRWTKAMAVPSPSAKQIKMAIKTLAFMVHLG